MAEQLSNAADLGSSNEQGEADLAGRRAFALIGEVLSEDGWHAERFEDETAYRMIYTGDNGELGCFAHVRMDWDQLLFYVATPVRIPSGRRAVAAEFITRANYGMRIGNFEMDFADGEVRFKSSVGFRGGELEPYLVRNAVYPAVRTTDRYLAGLLAVAFGGQSAEEAIAEIEG